VHTCLSPCGDLMMSPRKIAAQACKKHIDILAICDHNSAENVPAVMRAARMGEVTVLPGMEICTREEIHVLAIFEYDSLAFAMQSIVYDRLPGKNDADAFGLQVVANEHDEVVGIQERLLMGAVELSVDEVVSDIHTLGGVAIASHIDREHSSVISQLGFIPATLRFDALELSVHITTEDARERFAPYAEYAFVRNSDAHFLDDVGNNTSEYLLERPTFSELARALRRTDGRMVCEG